MVEEESQESLVYHKCGECCYVSFTSLECLFHTNSHKSELNCCYCPYVAANTTDFKKHSALHDAETPHSCEKCSYKTHNYPLLVLHQSVHNEVSPRYTCKYCTIVSSNAEVIIKHTTLCKKKSNTQVKTTPVIAKSPDTTVKNTVGPEKKKSTSNSTPNNNSNKKKEVKKPWWDTSSQLAPLDVYASNKEGDCDFLGRPLLSCNKCDRKYNQWETHSCSVLAPHTCMSCTQILPDNDQLVKHLVDEHTRIWNSLNVDTDLKQDTAEKILERLIPESYKMTAESVTLVSSSNPDRPTRLHRCIKCYSIFDSMYTLAGHQLICSNTRPPEITACCMEGYSLTDEHSFIEHYIKYHTCIVVGEDNSQLNNEGVSHQGAVANPVITDTADQTVPVGITAESDKHKDAELMITALQQVGEDIERRHADIPVLKVVEERECLLCKTVITDSDDEMYIHVMLYHCTYTNMQLLLDNHACMKEQYGCNICDFICDDKSTLQQHMSLHSGDSPHYCLECGCKFGTAKSLQSHMANHFRQRKYDQVTQPANRRVKCSACSFIASSKTTLEEHSLSEHQRNIYVCGEKQCEFTTDSQELLDAHMKTDHNTDNTKDKRLCCHICGFQTANKYSLKSHIEKHEGKKRYKCTECPFTTLHASSLNAHFKSHSGYRPFICQMCGKSFTTNSELRKHEKRHAGLVERRHKCTCCDKAYSSPQHLTVHMRNHTGERPYKCHLCSFAATSKSVLTNHMPIHTGEKNYKCHLCPFVCASSGTLSNHRKLKHKIFNKRKTLAESTPEGIINQAAVAGKSRRLGKEEQAYKQPVQQTLYAKMPDDNTHIGIQAGEQSTEQAEQQTISIALSDNIYLPSSSSTNQAYYTNYRQITQSQTPIIISASSLSSQPTNQIAQIAPLNQTLTSTTGNQPIILTAIQVQPAPNNKVPIAPGNSIYTSTYSNL